MRNMLFALAGLAASLALPTGSWAQDAPPPGVVEVALTLGEGEWAVPAVLTLPAGDSKAPAVLLEHGFGPGTLDADVGPNKIFRETAWGLAQRGVAVLRHAKRSTVHADLIKRRGRHQTIEEEWLEDAATGIALLKADRRIDGERVYVAGHSASAGFAPGLALSTGAAGAVLVSGSPRRPSELIREQVLYVSRLSAPTGQSSAETQQLLADVERLDDAATPDSTTVMGHPLWYWRSLAARDVLGDIAALRDAGGRVYVVQGGRDYLVGEPDWRLWRAAFPPAPEVARHLYPGLNHMMQPGEGKMTPEEYGRQSALSSDYLDALAGWLKL